MVTYKDLSFFLINPTWGESFVGGNKIIELNCSSISLDYSSSTRELSYFDYRKKSKIKKSAQNSGSLNLVIPATAENFDFLFDCQNQETKSARPPKCYFAGCLLEGLLFKNLSFSLAEDGNVAITLNFSFENMKRSGLEIIETICYELDTDLASNILTDELGDVLTNEIGEFLTTEALVNENTQTIEIDEDGNFVIDEACALASNKSVLNRFSVANIFRASGYVDYSQKDRMLNMAASDLTINTPTVSGHIDFNDLNIISLDFNYSCSYKGVKKIGECVPSRLLRQDHQLSLGIGFVMLQEMELADFIGSQESDGQSYQTFQASILLKDLENSAVSTTIIVNSNLESIDSNLSSLGIPQGSIKTKQQIT